jgi:opine dehydrogenase
MPTIAEMEGLLFNGFKQNQTTVRVVGYKAGLACATLPAGDVDKALARLKPIAADLQPAANVLETGLRNLNPVVHGPVSLLNAGRTAPDRDSWRYYWDGVTEPVGKVVEAVDAERRAVTSAFGLTLKPMMDTLLQWYGHQGAKGDTVGAVMSTNPAYEMVTAPSTLDHRFLTEDIPFGLVPLEALGAAAGVAVPVTGALITLASALLGVDYRAEGRNLMRLGLEGLAPSQIQHWVETGVRPG